MSIYSRYYSLRSNLYKYSTSIHEPVSMDPIFTDSWNKTPIRREREVAIECSYCKMRFELPLFPKPILLYENLTLHEIQAQNNEIEAHKKTHHDPVVKELEQHLIKEHGIKHCSHCNTYVVGSYLRKHQRSYDCKVAARENVMKERGLVQIDIMSYINQMYKMYKLVSADLPWDSNVEREALKDTFTEVKRTFRRLGEITPVLTYYSKSPDDRGWQERDWAPAQVGYGLELIQKVFKDQPEQMNREAWKWLQMDEDSREAQIGGFELMAEYNESH